MSSREEFEAWYRKEIYPGGQFSRDRSENYNMPSTQLAWRAWQASRQTLLVELLPNQITHGKYPTYEDGWNDMRHQAEKAIEAAGVRVKE